MENPRRENWLCKNCEFYKGMDDEKGCVTRCGDPQWSKYFQYGKDYLLHYALCRPNWCKREVEF